MKITRLNGGCIASSYRLDLENKQTIFIKTHSTQDFNKEANGLRELKKANSIAVPDILICRKNFLALEWIESGRKPKNFFKHFAEELAQLHRYTSDNFGFYEDNYIGSMTQENIYDTKNWQDFYYHKRLLFQIKIAEKNGYATREFSKAFLSVEKKLVTLMEGSENIPSLLHGDLWSGNYMIGNKGQAVIIDPAVYYGNREADLAMTMLFGGFPMLFYEEYNKAFPLANGYEKRIDLYKLYHILNHMNLFGISYRSQAITMMNNLGHE
ncbi:fructosamine kinase family protein [Candidatus Uabimicrobium sp. HlEnr_7]|uniref:fructosamine kinase family protein n=1 Tax=Candidatus Uabimicrobium helgolandensis TaxID=3095367 RepID=UPI003556A8AC